MLKQKSNVTSILPYLCSLLISFRAKLVRSEQNRRAYQQRTRDRSKLVPTWPNIPRVVHQQAAFLLPTNSHFFKKEYRLGGKICDDDALAIWDSSPPYAISSASLGSVGLEVIIDRVHGRHLREQYQDEARRLERYRNADDDDILKEIDCDVHRYLAAWNTLRLALQLRPESPIDHTMGHHLLQWKARRIVDLLNDWKVVKKGRSQSTFSLHFSNRWSKY